jgi:hypothetical protein
MWGEESSSVVFPDGRVFRAGDVIEFKWYQGIGPARSVSVENVIIWKINHFSGQPERGPPIGIAGAPWRHEAKCYADVSQYRPEIILPGGIAHYGIHPMLESITIVEDFEARCAAAYESNLASDIEALKTAMIKAEADALTAQTEADAEADDEADALPLKAVEYFEALKTALLALSKRVLPDGENASDSKRRRCSA